MRTVVGVLRGGPSREYDVSLKTGASALQALNREKYDPRDIFIDREGTWHMHGMAMPPEKALRGVDVAFNAMHGEYGEDGEVQRVLNTLAIPYTGSNAHASSLAFNKARTKQIVKKLGIRTPRALLIEREEVKGDMEELAYNIFRTFPHPAIVKPATGGSSIGVVIVSNFHTLAWALEEAFKISSQALVEEYIRGREATVGVIDNFRNEKIYSLFPIEIIPQGRPFFDYDAKYGGRSVQRVPGHFTYDEKVQLMNMAKTVHDALGLHHYSRSDFIVSRRGIYFLEVNTLPGLTAESLFPKGLEAVGSKLPDFLEHVIHLARR
ncbi:MAG TPA: D-alanine--D-alanine ligase [Candidatus Paceibacterota bacterium]|nr:D-alanine--D-alanine ligase [Candidatus Paceibacterota bacterium]